ncbi:trypsin-like serine peptidase [Aquisphaera insulae]|uniref:trypsin-like serine peptidase n=1 Tax=Aquisphaera insulae TaxID=2712864 RepID=UPI0013EB9C48|nr:serine protease [Aquisphaera insulae]
MKNDPKLISKFSRAIRRALPNEGDLDLLAADAGLADDWVNFKVAPQLELALNRFLQRAEVNRKLMDVIDAALDRSDHFPELQALADQYVKPIREPLESLGAKVGDFEKVLFRDAGFVDIAVWLSKLGLARLTVCLIRPNPGSIAGCGTGFLVAPDLVMTNWHVAGPFWDREEASSRVSVEFDRELGPGGELRTASAPCRLNPEWDLPKSPMNESDFALLRLNRRAADDIVDGHPRGYLDLSTRSQPELAGLLPAGAPMLIVQHPMAEPLKLALGEADRIEDARYLWHRVNTEPGSSGSPCFSQKLEVIALHHYGADTTNRAVLASSIEPSIREAVRAAGA